LPEFSRTKQTPTATHAAELGRPLETGVYPRGDSRPGPVEEPTAGPDVLLRCWGDQKAAVALVEKAQQARMDPNVGIDIAACSQPMAVGIYVRTGKIDEAFALVRSAEGNIGGRMLWSAAFALDGRRAVES